MVVSLTAHGRLSEHRRARARKTPNGVLVLVPPPNAGRTHRERSETSTARGGGRTRALASQREEAPSPGRGFAKRRRVETRRAARSRRARPSSARLAPRRYTWFALSSSPRFDGARALSVGVFARRAARPRRRAGELGLGALVRHARSRRGRVERATRQCARGKARLGTSKKKRRRTFLSSTSPLGSAHF